MNLSPLFKGICGGVPGVFPDTPLCCMAAGEMQPSVLRLFTKGEFVKKCLGKRRGQGENRTPRRERFPLFFLTFG